MKTFLEEWNETYCTPHGLEPLRSDSIVGFISDYVERRIAEEVRAIREKDL